MQRNYQICSHCILDTTDDPNIRFDENGVCNHCHFYQVQEKKYILPQEVREKKLAEIVEQMKREGKNKEYDCVMGVSGGVDSTYAAYITKQLGLRALVIHLDNGWNSELAVKNIENIVQRLNYDLYTHVIDWEEFKDLQLSFLKASVVDIELLTDHAISACLLQEAKKRKIKFIISGVNMATEGVLPSHWTHRKMDLLNIISIHKKFGKIPLKTFPQLSFLDAIYCNNILKIQSVPILNYVPYIKTDAKKKISDELGWRDYGGKHYESIFTRFYQGYILPVKFHIDKRKAHLSSLVCSGQITRTQSLNDMQLPNYDSQLLKEDKQFVIKKFGLTEKEFEQIMALPIKKHLDYPSYVTRHYVYHEKFFKAITPLISFCKSGMRKFK